MNSEACDLKISEEDLKKHEEFIRSLSDYEIKELLALYRRVYYPVKPVDNNCRDGFCGSCGRASAIFYNQKGACVWCGRHKMDKEICLTCDHWTKVVEHKVFRPILQLDGDLTVRTLANKVAEIVTRVNDGRSL